MLMPQPSRNPTRAMSAASPRNGWAGGGLEPSHGLCQQKTQADCGTVTVLFVSPGWSTQHEREEGNSAYTLLFLPFSHCLWKRLHVRSHSASQVST